MIALFIHDDAKRDLLDLHESEPIVSGKLLALFEQLQGDPDLLDRLTQHDYGAYHTGDFHVSKWQEQWRQGKDLWRLKVWDLEDDGLRHRVIYAFQPRHQHYHVLGIVPREFDYDSSHPLAKRILAAYEEL